MTGVLHHVQQDLLDLVRVAADHVELDAEVLLDADLRHVERVLHEVDRFPRDKLKVDVLHLGLLFAGEAHEAIDDAAAARRFFAHDLDVAIDRAFRGDGELLELAHREIRVAQDAGEGVLHFVRETRRERAHGRELFALHEGFLRGLERDFAILEGLAHVVEGLGQLTDFVATLARVDAHREVARLEQARGVRHLFDRRREPARKPARREKAEAEEQERVERELVEGPAETLQDFVARDERKHGEVARARGRHGRPGEDHLVVAEGDHAHGSAAARLAQGFAVFRVETIPERFKAALRNFRTHHDGRHGVGLRADAKIHDQALQQAALEILGDRKDFVALEEALRRDPTLLPCFVEHERHAQEQLVRRQGLQRGRLGTNRGGFHRALEVGRAPETLAHPDPAPGFFVGDLGDRRAVQEFARGALELTTRAQQALRGFLRALPGPEDLHVAHRAHLVFGDEAEHGAPRHEGRRAHEDEEQARDLVAKRKADLHSDAPRPATVSASNSMRP